MTVKLTINIPDELRRQARSVAALRGETVSEVVRGALEVYVAAHRGDNGARQATDDGSWEGDSLFNLVGIGQGGPEDLSSDKYAYFTEAFD